MYLREPVPAGGLPDGFGLKVVEPRLTALLWEQLVLAKRSKEMDVLFGPSYTLPLGYRGRCVVAIHSANETQPGSHPWWYFAYKELYELSAKKADAVIVPSESTKADIQRHYGIAAEKIAIVPQGADDSFRPIHDEQLLTQTRTRLLGDNLPYILFVGKLSQRRNVPLLMEAFARLKRKTRLPHKLVLFGPNHVNLPLTELAERLGITADLVQTDGKVTDHKELVAIYNAADVFVHPSSYEGWSMTTMEALACGTAVVAVNRGGLGEVANGHASMIEEPTAENLADSIEQVLTDPALKQQLREKARKRGSQFRWEDTSRMTLDVMRRVAAGQA